MLTKLVYEDIISVLLFPLLVLESRWTAGVSCTVGSPSCRCNCTKIWLKPLPNCPVEYIIHSYAICKHLHASLFLYTSLSSYELTVFFMIPFSTFVNLSSAIPVELSRFCATGLKEHKFYTLYVNQPTKALSKPTSVYTCIQECSDTVSLLGPVFKWLYIIIFSYAPFYISRNLDIRDRQLSCGFDMPLD